MLYTRDDKNNNKKITPRKSNKANQTSKKKDKYIKAIVTNYKDKFN